MDQINDWLPLAFLALMGLSVLIYAVLDGYDLGVGILIPLDNSEHSDHMIASIGPFWDANETWLVLAVGILLIAFPVAHSQVLYALYLPSVVMLSGLILRGVAFDFRAKAAVAYRELWDKAFKVGSLVVALSQGYMLGRYVLGFESGTLAYVFAGLSAVCVASAYTLIGACWLIMKTSGNLQLSAAKWAKYALILTGFGIIAISIINPLISPRIFDKWFSLPQVLLLWIVPVLCFGLFALVYWYLRRMPLQNDLGCWIPFASVAMIFVLAFIGLGYSFYPYVIPEQLNVWEAASARESLWVIFIGVAIVLPCILGYTIFAYRVFWGKAGALKYY